MSFGSKSLRIASVVFIVAVIGFSCWWWSPEPWGSARRVYRIGVNDDPPIQFRTPEGLPGGLAIDIVAEAARRARIHLEWVYSPEGPDAALASHRVDLWPVLTIRPEREGRVHISVPWFNNEYVLVATHALELNRLNPRFTIFDMPVNRQLAAQYFPSLHFS